MSKKAKKKYPLNFGNIEEWLAKKGVEMLKIAPLPKEFLEFIKFYQSFLPDQIATAEQCPCPKCQAERAKAAAAREEIEQQSFPV